MIEGSSLEKFKEDPHKDKPAHERLECYKQDAIAKIKGSQEDIAALKDMNLSLEQLNALAKVQKAMLGYDKSTRENYVKNKQEGYNEETDHRVIASELQNELEPLRKRIIALEVILEIKSNDAVNREKLLAEKDSTIALLRREIVDLKKHGNGNKFTKQKDVDDEQ